MDLSSTTPDFRLNTFGIWQRRTAMKIGTDAILLGSWVSSLEPYGNTPDEILDVGTGTGILALMMAQHYPNANILAVDVDTEALADARYNIEHSIYKSHIQVMHLNFAHESLPYTSPLQYDLIISNPPYFASTGIISPNNARSVARHEGEGGLTLDKLLERSAQLLAPRGRLCLIAPIDRISDLRLSATIHGLRIARLCLVYSTPNTPIRYLLELTPLHISDPHLHTEQTILHLRQENGMPTDEYRRLTDLFLPH